MSGARTEDLVANVFAIARKKTGLKDGLNENWTLRVNKSGALQEQTARVVFAR